MARSQGKRSNQRPFSIPSVQAAIAEQGAGWSAGETPLTSLSADEQASYLGLSVGEGEIAAMTQLTKAAERLATVRPAFSAPPTSVDWRNNSGNFITPIKDQKGCGSCVSFATIATIESRANIVCKTPGLGRDYSEAHLFFCGCGACCGRGWNFDPALSFCQKTGVVEDSAFPYTPSNQPCPTGLTPLFKLTGYSSVQSMADRKNAIATRGPVVAGFAVYQDFFSYRSGVYRHVTGGLAGYHAVSIVGYSDAEGCWIAKNSWGESFGEQGFFKIAYGQCEIDSGFAFFEPQVPCVAPAPDNSCKRYASYLRRVLSAARTNPRLRSCLRASVCGRGPLPTPDPRCLQIIKIVKAILRRCGQYRTPFCRLLG